MSTKELSAKLEGEKENKEEVPQEGLSEYKNTYSQ